MDINVSSNEIRNRAFVAYKLAVNVSAKQESYLK